MITRRRFVSVCAAGAAGLLAKTATGFDASGTIHSQTFIYKRASGLDIKLDVLRTGDDRILPVLFWLHGGALILGSRKNISREIRSLFLEAGYALVSIDYRLAPETKLPQILEDVQDAYAWVIENGTNKCGLDTRRVAVAGASAGGYLALCCGFRVDPRPAVVGSLWGYGDILGDWYTKPSAVYQRAPLVTREQAYKAVAGPPIANQDDGARGRGDFYRYCRQNGLWPKEVGGYEPDLQRRLFEPYMPISNVTRDYPPTILVHGTADEDVPYEQSMLMAGEFQKHGVKHELVTLEGAGHGLSGAKPDDVLRAHRSVLEFVQQQIF